MHANSCNYREIAKMWCNLAIESRLSCEHLAIFFQILYLLPILDIYWTYSAQSKVLLLIAYVSKSHLLWKHLLFHSFWVATDLIRCPGKSGSYLMTLLICQVKIFILSGYYSYLLARSMQRASIWLNL